MHKKIVGITLNGWLAICLLAASWLAYGQSFKLGKPVKEDTAVCFTKAAAVAIANEGGKDVVVLVARLNAGDCFLGKAIVVYSRLVHHNGGWRVYEGTVGQTPVFVPTTWTSEKEVEI